jgi:hypothetical protein
MLQSDKDALHFDVIANTAHKISIVSQHLAHMYRGSTIFAEDVKHKKDLLCNYFNELNNLLQTI